MLSQHILLTGFRKPVDFCFYFLQDLWQRSSGKSNTRVCLYSNPGQVHHLWGLQDRKHVQAWLWVCAVIVMLSSRCRYLRLWLLLCPQSDQDPEDRRQSASWAARSPVWGLAPAFPLSSPPPSASPRSQTQLLCESSPWSSRGLRRPSGSPAPHGGKCSDGNHQDSLVKSCRIFVLFCESIFTLGSCFFIYFLSLIILNNLRYFNHTSIRSLKKYVAMTFVLFNFHNFKIFHWY